MTTAIIDYGMGNLRSVQKAFERIGEPAVISSDASDIATASRVVLPGVGAFRDAIAALHQHDLVGVITDHISANRPFLGICLGLQLLILELQLLILRIQLVLELCVDISKEGFRVRRREGLCRRAHDVSLISDRAVDRL